ncbi:Hypothetical predicted protein [Lecanosticta acicola]|uniref:Aminoglycoside phosphotransferase domain-containing protein n=1 Tax=Lecanosticta acicola TaxID=111012 RepID=A0AAI9E7F1_9PEZI|nr:Hypothetical predicted protein [Lecanosticta acicola]
MTKFAHGLLGSVVPHLKAFVSITGPPEREEIIIARQHGVPLVELWPTLSSAQRATVKNNLVSLIISMRTSDECLRYYGRPGGQPYITQPEFGPNDKHDVCHTRSDWNASRVRALRSSASDAEIDEDRIRVLERVQYETGVEAVLVERSTLTHGDLSHRNILLDPSTLEITGLIDWESGNVAPAYLEYTMARLSGGHDPEWRRELLEILRDVLCVECERGVRQRGETDSSQATAKRSDELFSETLAAWNALVDVERPANGYSDDGYWTFEDEDSLPVLASTSTDDHTTHDKGSGRMAELA